MTQEEKIVIKATAFLESLERYEYVNQTYCGEIKNALANLDYEKLEFCLQCVKLWLEQRDYFRPTDEDYVNLIDILNLIAKSKNDRINRLRETIPLMQFWTAINAWLEEEAKDPADLYCEKYQEGYTDWGRWFTVANVDKDKLYKIVYGHSYATISENNITLFKIKEFVEAYYKEVVEPEKGRLKYTIKVNELLARFHLPYRLQKGKLLSLGYRSSYRIETIENFEQFERKIEYAAEMILHGDFIDKHSALNYITDAFCYLQSIYKKAGSKELIELVNQNNNSQVYRVIKDEVEFINRIINTDFDIRHNEENAIPKNGCTQKREVLSDPMFVEYLYNRINSILTLLRIKHSQKLRRTNNDENI